MEVNMKARYIPNTIVSKGAQASGWLFGSPVLIAGGDGQVNWDKNSTYAQKGTGWQAVLYGGVQSGDDWAACYFPVNELPVVQFDNAQWSWYQTNTETMGLGIVIWIHDPTDFDKRAEVTQLANVSGLDKSAGWNSHEFDSTVTQMFFYGENTTGTDLTAGTQYTWDEFQADTLFKNWVIYRISFDWGWEASGTFENVYLTEVKLCDMYISVHPEHGKFQKTVTKTKTLVGGVNSAFDVLSESASAGTDWDFEFGGQGKIIDAVMSIGTTALTAETSLHCFSKAPTCNLNDNVANTSPLDADIPYFLGAIEFAGLRDYGTTSRSYTHASPSTVGGLPIRFNSGIVKAVLISVDAMTPGAVLCTISMTAEMEYN